MDEDDLITLTEARQRLGISKVTMARLIKEGRFNVYENLLDKREKLVSSAEVDQFHERRIVRIQPRREEGKAAA